MSPPPNTSNHLEALKLVKDWSSGLVVVQSAAIGVVGSLLKQPPSDCLHLIITMVLLGTLIFSIWLGAVGVSGTVPYIAQNLSSLQAKANAQNKDLDIYAQKGGIASDPDLGMQCRLQSYSFIFSLFLFAVFILSLPPQVNSQ
jgi:hypothetical protein